MSWTRRAETAYRSGMQSPGWPLLATALLVLAAACGSDVEDGAVGGAGPTTASGPTTPFDACDAPGTCTLAVRGCCGGCDRPSLEDRDAVNVDSREAHRDAHCPPDEDLGCPDCDPPPNPGLFAYCDGSAGVCAGADLPETELATCDTPDDCVLRAGAGCCEGCNLDADRWVALRSTMVGELTALVCRGDEACAECAPAPPEGLRADCISGRCRAVEDVP